MQSDCDHVTEQLARELLEISEKHFVAVILLVEISIAFTSLEGLVDTTLGG
jgi:hypothetical protein